jgi:hypothetical protein
LKNISTISKNEKVFDSFADFEVFLNMVINGYIEKTKGLYVKYKKEEYLCAIDVISVDPDRQMGTETIYEITFEDTDGEQIKVAEISEYPMGAFSIHDINTDVELNEETALNYFHEQSENYELT